MLATLPMYDLPEVRPAAEALLSAVARRLPGAPDQLVWPADPHAAWLDPGLVLGQSCGLPLVTTLAGRVRVVGAFTYRGISHRPGHYRSVLVAREPRPLAAFAGSTAAINGWESLSGCVSLGAAVAPRAGDRPFFAGVVVTGAHVRSLQAVQNGTADVAAIDAVTLALVRRFQPHLTHGLTVLGHGPEIPCLPLITAQPDVAPLRAALAGAVADAATAAARGTLLIEGFVPLAEADYVPVVELARRAAPALRPPRRHTARAPSR